MQNPGVHDTANVTKFHDDDEHAGSPNYGRQVRALNFVFPTTQELPCPKNPAQLFGPTRRHVPRDRRFGYQDAKISVAASGIRKIKVSSPEAKP